MKVNLNGVNYNVERSGEGSPLLFLHGFTGSSATWQPFAPAFTESSRIYIDLLGHGQTDSPKMSERYHILKVAADLKQLLDILEIEKTDLLGYSMGGRLALTFSLTYPERVNRLVLESTTPGLRTELERNQRRELDARLADRILHEGLEKFILYWENIALFQTQLNLSSEVRERIRRERLQHNPLGLANSLRGMGTGAQPSWWESLHRIQAETLLLTGELDEKFCRIGEEMVRLLPRAELLQLPGVGHAIHVEEPEKFGTIVSGFLSKQKSNR